MNEVIELWMSMWKFLNMNGIFFNVNEENMNVNLECEKRKKIWNSKYEHEWRIWMWMKKECKWVIDGEKFSGPKSGYDMFTNQKHKICH